MPNKKLILLLSLITGVAFLRLLPHPPNFTPILAMAVFAGTLIQDKRWAYAFPLGAMILGDAFLGFHSLSIVVYLSFALMVYITHKVTQGKLNYSKVALSSSVIAPLVFFVTTNFAVWVQGGIYPRTLEGLGTCFLMAIPFFKNTWTSSVMFSFILFGVHWLVFERENYRKKRLEQKKADQYV